MSIYASFFNDTTKFFKRVTNILFDPISNLLSFYGKINFLQYLNLMGFVDNSETTLSLTGASFDTVQLAPTGTTFTYYFKGEIVTVTGTRTIQLANTNSGTHFIYFDDNTGVLKTSNTAWDILNAVPVATVFWDNANTGQKSLLADERHTAGMLPAEHKNLHLTEGTKIVTAAVLTGYVTGGTPTNAANTFAISQSVIADEDLFLTLAALTDGNGTGANYCHFFRRDTLGTWGFRLNNNFPFYFLSGERVRYDDGNAQSTICTSNRWINAWLILTNWSGQARHIVIFSQTQYTTQATAYAETIGSLNLTGLNLQENVVAYQITLHCNNSYTGAQGFVRIDRVASVNQNITLAISQAVSSSHGGLTGRDAANQHPIAAIYGTQAKRIPYNNDANTELEDDAGLTYDKTTSTLTTTNISVSDVQWTNQHVVDFDVNTGGITLFASGVSSLTNRQVLVFRNGVKQRLGAEYDYYISGSNIIFNSAVSQNAWIQIIVF